MPMPVEDPTSIALVKQWLQTTNDQLDEVIDLCVSATNDLVVQLRYPQSIDAESWPWDIVQGATMLASRLVRRRNSPDGVQALTDQGAVYVSRSDPDIAMLLHIGSYQRPAVG